MKSVIYFPDPDLACMTGVFRSPGTEYTIGWNTVTKIGK